MAKILCVDDVPDNLKLLAGELEDAGHDVKLASSGMEALASIEKEAPDLVILDILMPMMSGLEVLSRIRQQYMQIELPVLMVTVVDEESSVIKALALGANDYLVKPLELGVVLARVATQLNMVVLGKEREELYRQKEELLAIAVHDLRQPITAILATAEVAQEDLTAGRDNGSVLDDLQDICDAAGSMTALLDGLMDLRLLEQGRLHLDLDKHELAKLALQAVQVARRVAEPKGMSIELECDVSDTTVMADKVRLSQIAGNLLGNAVKYGPPSSSIAARVWSDDSWVRFEVRDRGPGFPEEQRARLFRKFSRLSTRPTANERCTGLGLYITKNLVQAHGGSVSARNHPEGGAIFGFSLPRISPPS